MIWLNSVNGVYVYDYLGLQKQSAVSFFPPVACWNKISSDADGWGIEIHSEALSSLCPEWASVLLNASM